MAHDAPADGQNGKPAHAGAAERPRPRTRAERIVRGLIPPAVSAAILYYFLRDQDWVALGQAAMRANLALAIPAIIIPQLVSWVLGTVVVERTFRWFHAPFPWLTYFWVRGAGYILSFVNTALGAGGLMLYQQRRARIGWSKLWGIVLFRVGLGLWGIVLVMIPCTLLMQQEGLGARTGLDLDIWWAVLAFGAAWLAEAWLHFHHGIELGFSRRIEGRRGLEFWTAFRTSTPRHWVLMWLYVLPQYFSMVIGYYFLNLAFGIDAPFVETLVSMPFAFLIMELPIAFSGFGTATLAWTTFFGSYGDPNDIAALTLALPSGRLLTRAAIGALSLGPGMRELSRMASEVDPGVPPGQPEPPQSP